MNNRGRKNSKQNHKVFIGIIITFGIIISICLLSLIHIPFLSSLSSKMLYSIDAAWGSIFGVITQGTSYFGNTKKLNEKVANLEKELEETKITMQEINVLKVENNDLKELLNIKERYNHFEKIYAKVIMRSYDNWNETFVIDKGKIDGIKEKQTVISADGLVGYISNVQENTSTVTTILDPGSAVSIEISNINALALVKGDYSLKNNGRIKLTNIPIDIELSEGEIVYSSGIGELYKKGIPVGTIREIISKKNDIDRYGVVDVFVDIESLSMVGVIIN